MNLDKLQKKHELPERVVEVLEKKELRNFTHLRLKRFKRGFWKERI